MNVHSLSMSLKFEGETSASATAFAMKRHSNARRIQLGGGDGGGRTDGHRGGGDEVGPRANRRGRKGKEN